MKKTWYEPSVGVFWTGWSLFFRDRVSVHTGEEFHSSDCRHVYGIDILIFFSTAYVHITHTRIHAKPGTSSFFWNGIIDTKVLCDALKERKNFLFSGSFPNPILRHSNDSHMTSLFRCFETFSKYIFFILFGFNYWNYSGIYECNVFFFLIIITIIIGSLFKISSKTMLS